MTPRNIKEMNTILSNMQTVYDNNKKGVSEHIIADHDNPFEDNGISLSERFGSPLEEIHFKSCFLLHLSKNTPQEKVA